MAESVHQPQRQMTTERFFELFLDELQQRPELYHYYKFLASEQRLAFRKAYFQQRLAFLARHVMDAAAPEQLRIWDCGCGYGTSCFFLAMNNIPSHGTTIEFYYDQLPPRYDFWRAHGPADLFTVSYEDLFEQPPAPASYDIIIVQDTLHHLEPLPEALKIFHQALAPHGKMILIEENGKNLIQRAKLFKQRGNKRVVRIYDEKLDKHLLLGNENIRSYETWRRAFQAAGFELSAPEYIRYLWPGSCQGKTVAQIRAEEQAIAQRSPWKRDHLFFGLNFLAYKT
jgi:SAM-dependent methyltransferase